jgi:hypothetical protein
MLYGQHEQDVNLRIIQAVGSERASAWTSADLSANPFALIYTQLSGLYQYFPNIKAQGPDLYPLLNSLRNSGWTAFMQAFQRDTLGLRDMILHVSYVNEKAVLRPVFPDLCEAFVQPENNELVLLKEWRLYEGAWERWVWVKGLLTRLTADGALLESTPLVDARGEEVFPFVVYHASGSAASFWDPYTGREVVEGSLNLAVQYTLFQHSILNATYAQRYVINAQPAGLQEVQGRAQIVGDASVILALEAGENQSAGTSSAGQWSAPYSPKELIEAIAIYEQRILGIALGTAEVARTTSDIRSGYSLAVTREARKEAQEVFSEIFRPRDIEVLNLIARLSGFDINVYDINYVLESPSERKRNMLEYLQKGIISPEQFREMFL